MRKKPVVGVLIASLAAIATHPLGLAVAFQSLRDGQVTMALGIASVYAVGNYVPFAIGMAFIWLPFRKFIARRGWGAFPRQMLAAVLIGAVLALSKIPADLPEELNLLELFFSQLLLLPLATLIAAAIYQKIAGPPNIALSPIPPAPYTNRPMN